VTGDAGRVDSIEEALHLFDLVSGRRIAKAKRLISKNRTFGLKTGTVGVAHLDHVGGIGNDRGHRRQIGSDGLSFSEIPFMKVV
jgi:hypothetical protein